MFLVLPKLIRQFQPTRISISRVCAWAWTICAYCWCGAWRCPFWSKLQWFTPYLYLNSNRVKPFLLIKTYINMKLKLILACVTLLMTSCSKTYYQVVEVKSTNLQKENSNYVYNDGVCKIIYNFWSRGGNAGFRVENLSDEVIYMDLGNTFYIKNGVAYDYYKARSYGIGKSSQITKVKSKGISEGISASATAYGVWRGITLDGYSGSISAQASSQTSFLTSYAISEGSSSSLSYAEKPIVAIPPHASKSFSEYKIMTDIIQDCSVNLRVKKNNPEGQTFDESESPINFENHITYRVGENATAKVVTNKFYIGGFTNYFYKDILKVRRAGCKKTVLKTVFDKYAPDCFYMRYNQKHSRDYSLDATGALKNSSDGSYYTVRKQ